MSVNTNVSDISQQISTTITKQHRPRMLHVKTATVLQAYPEEEMCCVILVIRFLSVKDLNPLDIDSEISAAYSHDCMCKAQVYKCVTSFKIDLTSLHDADRSWQSLKGSGALETEKSRQGVCFFFSLLEFSRWFTYGANALQSNGTTLKKKKIGLLLFPVLNKSFCMICIF